MTRTQRILGVLALAVLIGGPVAGAVCAMRCAPHRLLARPAAADAASHHEKTTTSAVMTHHHHDAVAASYECCPPATRVVASVGATGCDTHGAPDRDLQATLIAPRSDTHNPIAMPATVFDRAALTLAAALHTSSGHGPPLDTSQTPGSRSPVLRI